MSSGRFRAAQLAIGPVEPEQQSFDVAALDRGARPDPGARRGVAMPGNVVGDTLLLEEPGEFLDEIALRLGRQGGEIRGGEGEAHRGAVADARPPCTETAP